MSDTTAVSVVAVRRLSFQTTHYLEYNKLTIATFGLFYSYLQRVMLSSFEELKSGK